MEDLSKMTADERRELMKRLNEAEEAEARRKREQVDTYKELVNDAVEEAFGVLSAESQRLAEVKRGVYELFKSVKDMKGDLFKVKGDSQWSHAFINKNNSKRITLGTRTLDIYDDTAEEGIAMVNEYLDTLAKDNENAEQAVNICRSLMARDRKGNLKPSKIVTLYKHAKDSGNSQFLEGVETIMNAYKPAPSKTYIRAEFKTDTGMWKAVPLGITEADQDKK